MKNKMVLGLSLFELIVTISILGLILVASSGISQIYLKYKTHNQTKKLIFSLNYARNLAIHKHEKITICPIADASLLNPVCLDSADWSLGWMIFSNYSGDVYKIYSGLTNVQIIGAKPKIKFLPNGLLALGNQTFVIKIADKNHLNRCVVISRTARIGSTKFNDALCMRKP